MSGLRDVCFKIKHTLFTDLNKIAKTSFNKPHKRLWEKGNWLNTLLYSVVYCTLLDLSSTYIAFGRTLTFVFRNNQQLTGSLWAISTTSTCILILLWPSLNESIIEGRKGGSENRTEKLKNPQWRIEIYLYSEKQQSTWSSKTAVPQTHPKLRENTSPETLTPPPPYYLTHKEVFPGDSHMTVTVMLWRLVSQCSRRKVNSFTHKGITKGCERGKRP